MSCLVDGGLQIQRQNESGKQQGNGTEHPTGKATALGLQRIVSDQQSADKANSQHGQYGQ